MTSSISEFPPVARLCPNCEKAQFRDDVPQLFQAGSHLEFDQEHFPPRKVFATPGPDGARKFELWGIISTEFELMDSLPELPKLSKSSQDGCDFCRFLHEAIIFATPKKGNIGGTPGHEKTIYVTISYTWGPLRQANTSDVKSVYKCPTGLNAMEINMKVSQNETICDFRPIECEVQSLCGESFRDLAQQKCIKLLVLPLLTIIQIDSDAGSQWLRLGNRAYPSYCDADSASWMNQRLQLCKKEHDHKVFDQTYIPKRLVDVSSDTPRLILREVVPPSSHSSSAVRYAAISYCWGSGERQAKTTATTLQDRQAGISETEMPAVLRDAIKVTRALSIPFLWIDALCILQDDQSDWEQQCAEMHHIYGSAQLTFCVANSRSCNEGFLQPKNPRVRLPFQSHRVPDITSSFLVQLYWPRQRSLYDESWCLLTEEILQSPWNRRAWVFQESKLSFRKFIFGRSNLYFDCGEIQHARGKDFTSGVYLPHISASLAAKNTNDIYREWDEFVLYHYSRYDASSFSYAADLLPALSGLARLFANRLKDFYYAGHWERDLYRSLAWINTPSLVGQPMQPAGLIIPSWSRLSKSNTESYAHHLSCTLVDLHSEVKVQKARVVPVGNDPFGALKECRLWIRGYTLDLSRKEAQLSAVTDPIRGGIQWHLILLGRCFGHAEFDERVVSPGSKKMCASFEDFGKLKLLLLGSFREFVKDLVERGESEVSSICNCQDSVEKEEGEQENESLKQSDEECEVSCSQEQSSNRGLSTLGDIGDQHRQREIPNRQGYGLIISPTGNDGEYRRVGAVVAKEGPQVGPHVCTLPGDGNIEGLQSFAEMETVQLV